MPLGKVLLILRVSHKLFSLFPFKIAHRPRNRFALIDIQLGLNRSISESAIAAAVRNSLYENWGERAISNFRILCAPPLSVNRVLALIRFPRDSQVEFLSAIAFVISIAEIPCACRVLQVAGSLKNVAHEGILTSQRAFLNLRGNTKSSIDIAEKCLSDLIHTFIQLPAYA